MRGIYKILLSLMICGNLVGQQTVGSFLNSSNALDGYTLFSPDKSTITYLIDNCGELLHSWNSSFEPAGQPYLLENGILLRPGVLGGGGGALVEMIDWNGVVIWSHSVQATHGRQHHDIQPLPNGNILLLVKDIRSQSEVVQAGGVTSSLTINSEQIVEIQPDLINGGAAVVWEWKAWDHTIQDVNAGLGNYGVVSQHPEKIDINFFSMNTNNWLHINGIDYNEEFDQIIMSVRNFNEFWIIDHSTTTAEAASSTGGDFGKGGDLLYRWGNPISYDQGTISDQKLFLQHHTHWIDNGYPGEGKIILFNNEAGTPQGLNYSTVNTVELPVDANGNYLYTGGAYDPPNFDWTYQDPFSTNFFSSKISGAERLENGNTIVCEGVGGRFFEIDSNDNVVWEYINPVNEFGPITQNNTPSGNNVFRCSKYSPNYPAFSGKNLTPLGYIEIGSTHSCTLFPNSIIDVLNQSEINIYPNPVSSFIYIDEIIGPYKLSCTDSFGRIVFNEVINSQSISIDCGDWPNGLYFFNLISKYSSFTKKIVISH